jgi:RNA-directed DNA polymerase
MLRSIAPSGSPGGKASVGHNINAEDTYPKKCRIRHFLGFDFRRIRSRRGVWRAYYTPKLKKRTALLRKLRAVFRRYQSQPVDRVVQLINPILSGWVNYFAVGDSSECFEFIKDWVEKKVRRHMMRARKRKGFGWKRWSRSWLYEGLRLFNGYKVRRPARKAVPA